MFESRRETLDTRTHRYEIARDGTALTYSETLRLWHDDAAFREFFLSLLCDAPSSAYRWETPPITSATFGRRFEFVLLDTPGLSVPPDQRTFAEHFRSTNRDVVVFENLGADATLVAPTPGGKATDYSHFAAFILTAPHAQKHDLLRVVAQTVNDRLSARPLWVSTAGGGVAWLHVRLDSRPKYYGHQPYRQCD